MKVISIREPYASLILNNIKHIETRSWKTNYRGELYIHASLTKIKIPNNLLEFNNEFNYGFIICKCNLVDCIYVTDEFIEKIKNNNSKEYICGDYQKGRYAWILEDITPIKKIKAKGQLGIWNYKRH